jgi:hypothetical protein
MTNIINKRMTAHIEGDFVVFMIGMRINKFWKINQWLSVGLAMPNMLKELASKPEIGCLGFRTAGLGTIIQYWRSFEHLEAYARNRDKAHFPAWVRFNQRVGSNGDVGIWHETYKVAAGNYECLYNNMPLFGLAKVSTAVEATGKKKTAASRMGVRENDSMPNEVG